MEISALGYHSLPSSDRVYESSPRIEETTYSSEKANTAGNNKSGDALLRETQEDSAKKDALRARLIALRQASIANSSSDKNIEIVSTSSLAGTGSNRYMMSKEIDRWLSILLLPPATGDTADTPADFPSLPKGKLQAGFPIPAETVQSDGLKIAQYRSYQDTRKAMQTDQNLVNLQL